MNKLEFLVQDDNDTILPSYACGLKDKTVQVSYHGSTWATWKLQDQFEKHLEKCTTCENRVATMDLKSLTEFFRTMTVATRKADAVAKRVDAAMTLLADALTERILTGLGVAATLDAEGSETQNVLEEVSA
jgi:hypothetical protein